MRHWFSHLRTRLTGVRSRVTILAADCFSSAPPGHQFVPNPAILSSIKSGSLWAGCDLLSPEMAGRGGNKGT